MTELKASTWPPNFPDPGQVKHTFDLLEQVRGRPSVNLTWHVYIET